MHFPQKPQAPFVYIAGAGPGDPGLLTLKTYHALTHYADVIIRDRLIPEEILKLIPPHIPQIYAGKSCTHHTMTQDEINQALVEEAQKNQVVVRLKGGDPFIFGRGGEEAEHLMAHNIPFEIIPGVNAADGCAAYAGIPLTHRELASGVRFITGHYRKENEGLQDWKSMADPHTTLVIYMGLVRLDYIVEQLMANGLSPQTPAIAIQDGTLATMRSRLGSLETIGQIVKETEFRSPTLVIVGKVAALAAEKHR